MPRFRETDPGPWSPWEYDETRGDYYRARIDSQGMLRCTIASTGFSSLI